MNTYENQILRLCVQTYYNCYGRMPDARTIREMIGEEAFKELRITKIKTA